MENIYPLLFPEKKQIFSWFDTHLTQNTSYYPMVSGGPDSMFMAYCLFDYFFTKGRDVSTIHILHVNHKQRTSSDQEELFLSDHFSNQNITINKINNNNGQVMTESKLRKERWGLVKQYREKQGGGSILTGHNLSDRVETSFLHLLRGCKLPGIKNMSYIDTMTIDGTSLSIFRPLLSLSKNRIRSLCEDLHIPFFDDPSNIDSTISHRNHIRKKIQTFLGDIGILGKKEEKTFWGQIDTLYRDIEKKSSLLSHVVCPLKPSLHRDTSKYYKTPLPRNKQETYSLFSFLGVLGGISEVLIEEYTTFFKIKLSGWKWYNGWYFVIAHGSLYCFEKSFVGSFWEDTNGGKTLAINSLGVYTLGDFGRDISDETCIGGTMRYPYPHDTRKGKKLMKYLLNHKVPIFWRNYYPVIEKDNRLIAILDPLSLLGYI